MRWWLLTPLPLLLGLVILGRTDALAGTTYIWFEDEKCSVLDMSLESLGDDFSPPSSCKQTFLGEHFGVVRLKKEGEDLPVAVYSAQLSSEVKRVIVWVRGGPGTVIISEPKAGPLIDAFFEVSQRCDAAILVPAYAGTYDRSAYPESSHMLAEEEVGALMRSLASTTLRGVHIFSSSLGANILSSKDVPIPPGRHMIGAPMLRAPQEMLDSISPSDVRNGIWQNYYIGPPGKREIAHINQREFFVAYFGDDPEYLRQRFVERWKAKSSVSPDAEFVVLVADQDDWAGSLEYVPALRALGMDVRIIPGKHHGNKNGIPEDLEFFQSICP